MIEIPIQAVPNQELSILLAGSRYVIQLRTIDAIQGTAATILRDGATLVSNARAVAGFGILRYGYLVANAGNFAFVTPNDELPWWEQFDITHKLIFATEAEIANV